MPAAEAAAAPSWQVWAPEHQVAARILIVDDNSVARTTICALLDWHSFQVCGEAKDGEEAIEKVVELKPDIILLDINMPGMNGVRAAYEIRRIAPATKIVFLTIHDTPQVMEGVRVWSHGFVTKSATGTELIPTLDRLIGTPDKRPPAKSVKSKSRRAGAGG